MDAFLRRDNPPDPAHTGAGRRPIEGTRAVNAKSTRWMRSPNTTGRDCSSIPVPARIHRRDLPSTSIHALADRESDRKNTKMRPQRVHRLLGSTAWTVAPSLMTPNYERPAKPPSDRSLRWPLRFRTTSPRSTHRPGKRTLPSDVIPYKNPLGGCGSVSRFDQYSCVDNAAKENR
ncbi:hypothetical protein [Nocardia niwae]|uniref:hypothetical protein n=1 Tax=Nocardia niwae TaxID=626084 RepID=UPI0034115184